MFMLEELAIIKAKEITSTVKNKLNLDLITISISMMNENLFFIINQYIKLIKNNFFIIQ